MMLFGTATEEFIKPPHFLSLHPNPADFVAVFEASTPYSVTCVAAALSRSINVIRSAGVQKKPPMLNPPHLYILSSLCNLPPMLWHDRELGQNGLGQALAHMYLASNITTDAR